MIHEISAERLTLQRVEEIIENNYKLGFSADAIARVNKCRTYLDEKMKHQKEPIYGVSTGFGSLCNISVSIEELSQLQKNLVMSHACGIGDEVPSEIVRIMLLLKIQSLCYGNSEIGRAHV